MMPSRPARTLVMILAVVAGGSAAEHPGASPNQASVSAPAFVVDPFWPKPLPNNWILGDVGGVYVDSRDHVWIVTRPGSLKDDDKGAAATPPLSECCVPAPPVVEFDPAGNVVGSWGGPGTGYDWPAAEHGIFVDYLGNVWLGGGGNGDVQVLKFTSNGQFMLQIGRKDRPVTDQGALKQVQNMYVYPKANELFVADGGNRRVAVFDADTGEYKRDWGAYGNKPHPGEPPPRVFEGPGPQQFGLVHQVRMSNDGLLYVADQVNNRLQVFTPEGTFLKEAFVFRNTRDRKGTAHDVAFSSDAQQRFLYQADGGNNRVRILDRQTLQVVDSFGRHGPYAGQFVQLHGLAADSKGSIYTAEVYGGNRVQKFVRQ